MPHLSGGRHSYATQPMRHQFAQYSGRGRDGCMSARVCVCVVNLHWPMWHVVRATFAWIQDSHTSTHGAFGSFAIGIGTSEVCLLCGFSVPVPVPVPEMLNPIRLLHNLTYGVSSARRVFLLLFTCRRSWWFALCSVCLFHTT